MPLSRRALLKSVAATGVVSVLPRRLTAQAGSGRAALLRYLETHARPDGGYGFAEQKRSHLTPTFAVIGCHRLLGVELRDRARLIEFVRTHHPRELKKLEQERRIFDWQQIQALTWLGDDTADFRERIRKFTAPLDYLKQYERHGYPILQSELGVVQAHALLGLSLSPLSPAFPEYLAKRRRPNGSFNNTPALDGGDGHVMNTLWGLQASRVLGMPDEKIPEAIAWLRSCQLPGGGFTFQPRPMFGGVDDVAYTRAALRALRLLGGEPADRDGCLVWLHSLANADGGFADRPGWLSNPLATYHALDALDALGAIETLNDMPRRASRPRESPPADVRVFSIQIEAHGTGSPAEAVALASALRIDLWGAKNAKSEWMARVREIAAARRAPVAFFPANEEYGTWVDIPGLGTYSHTSDIVAPPTGDFGASLASQGAVTWPEFRARRLAPLEKAGGRLIWQFGENEELVRMLLDDSVERGGFAAISTFHFGNPDFTNTEPFLQRWRGRIPYISLQDAHGPEPWWFADITTGHRTLFLAKEPTWAAWLEALRRNWVVAVRHDEVSHGETWMHGGSPEVLEFVRAREREWRWWDDGPAKRPLVSLVALTPGDTLEAGRPESGVALRVRWAWRHTSQGVLQSPLAEFVKLTVDGVEVATTLVEKRRPNGTGLVDLYRVTQQPAGVVGGRRAVATVRAVDGGRLAEMEIVF